jgi:hypothetical protein
MSGTTHPGAGCLWPMWDHSEKPDHHYCGGKRLEGQSYCSNHYVKSVRSSEEEKVPFVPHFSYQKKAA